MTDQEEYDELKKDSRKILDKIRQSGSSKEIVELYLELDTIRRRRAKIRDRGKFFNENEHLPGFID